MNKKAGDVIVGKTIKGISSLEDEYQVNPFSYHNNKISRPTYGLDTNPIINLPDDKDVVRFAFVSLQRPSLSDFAQDSIIDKSDEQKLGIDVSACYRNRVNYNRTQANILAEAYIWAIDEALDNFEANIVAFSEMAFPAGNGKPYKYVFEASKTKAHKNGAVIIAGSFHDSRTKYNTGYIFYKGDENHPVNGWPFHKQVSATRLEEKKEGYNSRTGEHISIPPERSSVTFTAFGLNISVIICLDLMDYSTIASVVQQKDGVDFLLVPSCSSNNIALKNMAHIVSQSIPGGVAIINYYDEQQVSSTLHLFDNKQAESCPSYNRKPIPNNGGEIYIYDIPYTDFDKKKRQKQNNINKYSSLFGLPVKPVKPPN